MTPDEEIKFYKDLYQFFTKIANVFTDIYILKNGSCITLDNEKPFLVRIPSDTVDGIAKILAEFKILYISNIKEFKKSFKYQIDKRTAQIKGTSFTNTKEIPKSMMSYVTIDDFQRSRESKIFSTCQKYLDSIYEVEKWYPFQVSIDTSENTKLIYQIFVDNDYVKFLPEDNTSGPEIIFTKQLMPLCTEKNVGDLYYMTKKISDDLYELLLHFNYPLFEIFAFHYYIPIKEESGTE